MIIRDIHIDGFGVWTQRSLTGFTHGINIITGRNEAGKSTLQKFIRYTLFGYPHLTEDRMPPLKGGSHGGRIRCQLSSGEDAIFERLSGSKGGNIKLEYHGASSSNGPQWLQLLGNANAPLYDNIYAFSLDELVKLDSLRTSGVEDKIFSVGLGLGNTSLGNIESGITDQVNAIYLPSGSKQRLAKLMTEFLQKKARVQELQSDLPKYQALNREIHSFGEQLNHTREGLKYARNAQTRLKNFLSCYDSFVEAEHCRKGLLILPARQEYPANGLVALDKLEAT